MFSLKKACCAPLLLLFLALPVHAADFSATDLKSMSVFLSNFTELGFMDVDAAAFLDEKAPGDMIRFGIWHNYVNNFKSRIKMTPNGKYGAAIDAKFVAESVDRYFGLPLRHQNVKDADFYFDGRNYQFAPADGEATYYCQAKQVWERLGVGDLPTWRVTGDIYNTEDPMDRPATFEAFVYPSTWNGKETWIVQSLVTKWK